MILIMAISILKVLKNKVLSFVYFLYPLLTRFYIIISPRIVHDPVTTSNKISVHVPA